MSAELLAKLKIKKTPKIRESIIVGLPAAAEQLKDPTKATTKESIQIKTKILDKRKTANFDRDLFMSKIKDSQITKKIDTFIKV